MTMPTDPCAKCGSTKIVPRVRVIDRGHMGTDSGNVQVGAARRPHNLFKLQEKADVFGRVCGDCGFTELYVEEAAAIYEAYLQGKRE
jgi:predicted nucleic-acid-binding Zn-ribbon protein